MVRARAPTTQALGRRLLDGDEALPLQALKDRKRRRQWFTAPAVIPAPVRDRYSTRATRSSAVARLSLVVFIACRRWRQTARWPFPLRMHAPIHCGPSSKLL